MLDRHQQSGQKLTETPVAEFSYESMNSSLKALINIKAILFLIQWPFLTYTSALLAPIIYRCFG